MKKKSMIIRIPIELKKKIAAEAKKRLMPMSTLVLIAIMKEME